MNIEVFILNSFAKTLTGGNSAGVVIDSQLSEIQMLNIAKEVGFSETAFLNKANENNYKIRFFTPCAEVDLCGHATIAAFALLKDKKLIQKGEYFLDTKVGLIKVALIEDTIFMTQNKPEFFEILDSGEVLQCLNLNQGDLISNLPIQVVSTGLRDILVPVKSLETLLSMKPNFDKIAELSRKYNTIGIHAFSLESKNKATAHCRNFAPLYEMPEESATGTSNGALACYLFKYKLINPDVAKNLVFEQGYLMNKPSEILVSLDIEKNIIAKVNVGGVAFISGSKNIIIN